MGKPIVERDDWVADYINSLFLRPVWREPFPEEAPTAEPENGETQAEEPQVVSTQSDVGKPASITEEAVQEWVAANGWELRRPNQAPSQRPKEKKKGQAKRGEYENTLWQARSMVLIAHLVPALEETLGSAAIIRRLGISEEQYRHLKVGRFPDDIPVSDLTRRLNHLIRLVPKTHHDAVVKAMSTAHAQAMSEAESLMAKWQNAIGVEVRRRKEPRRTIGLPHRKTPIRRVTRNERRATNSQFQGISVRQEPPEPSDD